MTKRLSAYFGMPPADRHDLKQRWSMLQTRRIQKRVRRKYALVASGGVMALLLAAAPWLLDDLRNDDMRKAEQFAEKGALFETGDEQHVLDLVDGSDVTLERYSKLKVRESSTERMSLEVKNGRAHFNVVKRHGRSFQVSVGDVRISVIGTRFTVEMNETGTQSGEVLVSVTEGVVEVKWGERKPVRVRAGERWFSASSFEEKNGKGDVNALKETTEVGEPETNVPTVPQKESPTASRSNVGRGPNRHSDSTLDDLWAKAQQARRDGRYREAADAFKDISRRFPDSRTASMAAFERGRLCMDILDDLKCARAALRRSASSETGAIFHEDALVRLIRVYDARGEIEARDSTCKKYSQQYPKGIHRESIATICGDL